MNMAVFIAVSSVMSVGKQLVAASLLYRIITI